MRFQPSTIDTLKKALSVPYFVHSPPLSKLGANIINNAAPQPAV